MPDPKPTAVFIAPLREWLQERINAARDMGCADSWDAGYYTGEASAYESVLEWIDEAIREAIR